MKMTSEPVATVIEHRRIKVLFADDDEDILELLALAAVRIGHFDYCLARDGAEVETCLENGTFDVLCLDAEMPVAYGTTIARLLRAQHNYVPIIFFTGRNGREVRLTAEEVKATIVEKPASLGDLMELIRKLAQEHGGYQGPERRTTSVNQTEYRRRATDRPFALPDSLKEVVPFRRTA